MPGDPDGGGPDAVTHVPAHSRGAGEALTLKAVEAEGKVGGKGCAVVSVTRIV